jgi:hypothetical protein
MKKIIVGIVILIFTNISIAKAISYVAGDLTYTCLGGNNYLISVVLYIDCSGNIPGSTIPLQLKCIADSSMNFTANLSLLPGSGQEVTPGCGISLTTCHGGTRFGVKEYVYQGSIVLLPCNNWIMSYSNCCRNGVNTIFNSTNIGFRIKAMLNNIDAPCNSSTSFSNKPIAIICKNQNICFNQGALDPNGDSLVFSLVRPESDIENQYVNYYPPYSCFNFLPSSQPISIENLTGDICLEPSVIINSNTMVKIDQYKNVNGTLIIVGTNYREIQFRTTLCDNFIPILSGMDFNHTHQYDPNDTIFFYEALVGENIDFDINTYDPDTFNPDINCHNPVLYLSWDKGIPNASFSPINNGTDSAYARFNWIPTSQDILTEPHRFNVTVHDNACPYYGKNTYSFYIKVGLNTGIEEQEIKGLDYQISPNPSNGIFNILIDMTAIEQISYQIFSTSGSLIAEDKINELGANNSISFDLSNYPKGIYYILIRSKEFLKTEKIVIY